MSFDLESLRAGYRTGAFTPREIAREALRRIAAYADPAVWISRLPDAAVMAGAAALEADPAAKDLPLYGIPFAVKDNIDVAGLPTTAACPAFAYQPAETAPAVARLLAAGALLLGKTNLDQFATGLVGTRSPFGTPACVFDTRYIPGGSSSGSAIAVAAGLAAFALGTDTAGSGRVPAAFNNIAGLKPTRGLLSTRGVVPACRSLDCLSIFAARVDDADRIAAIAQGFDAADPFSRADEARRLPRTAFRFGVLKDSELCIEPDCVPLYRAAAQRLAALGGSAVEIDYGPFAEAAALLYGGPWVAERYAAIRDFIAAQAEAMDPTVRGIIEGARAQTAADAFDGQYRLAALKREADAQWARMDVLLLPTATAQFTIEEIAEEPVKLNARLGRYTNFVNLLDCCAIALPAGFRANGLAFGVTLAAPAFTDRALAHLAARLQEAESYGAGADKGHAFPPRRTKGDSLPDDTLSLFVVGAHLTGMPLNRELTEAGGLLLRKATTTADYRLFVLPGTTPPKPGLMRAPGHQGPGIAGEVWALPPAAFGHFVARIPAPLGIGKITLADGTAVSGFLCESYVLDGAEEITRFGGWRAYRTSLGP